MRLKELLEKYEVSGRRELEKVLTQCWVTASGLVEIEASLGKIDMADSARVAIGKILSDLCAVPSEEVLEELLETKVLDKETLSAIRGLCWPYKITTKEVSIFFKGLVLEGFREKSGGS